MSPLAVVCHNADIWSARFCPERPLADEKDTWHGAYRHSEIEDLVDYIRDLGSLKIYLGKL